MGVHNPVAGSEVVTDFISQGWESKVGGKLEFVTEAEEILARTIAHIDQKRAALGLPEYDASKWGRSGDRRIASLLDLPVEERIEAAYGVPEAAD
jgi:hypothetical protein